jgi:hypothetical protein
MEREEDYPIKEKCIRHLTMNIQVRVRLRVYILEDIIAH